MNDKKVLDFINNWLRQWQNISSICTNTIPCHEGGMNVLIYEPICWQYRNIDGRLWLTGCLENEAYCSENYVFCYDTQLGIMVRTKTYGPGISGYPDCTFEWTDVWSTIVLVSHLGGGFTYSTCFHFPDNMCGY